METLGPYLLGHNPINAGIYTGNSLKLSAQIPDSSVDLIICDPVYWETGQYKWLAETAVRVLKDGGNLVAQAGFEYRYSAECAMYNINGMTPRPLLVEAYTGGFQQVWNHRSLNAYAPYIWMTKGKDITREAWVRTLVRGGGKDKSLHEWGDSPAAFFTWIEAMTDPGDVVFDPFTGSGVVPACCAVLGRRYLAFEIDPETADKARSRLSSFQLPLSFDIFRQVEMDTTDGDQ